MKVWNPERLREKLAAKKAANKDFTRAELAEKSGITKEHLSSVLVGLKTPSRTLLIVLALNLGTNADYLNWNSDDPRPEYERAA